MATLAEVQLRNVGRRDDRRVIMIDHVFFVRMKMRRMIVLRILAMGMGVLYECIY